MLENPSDQLFIHKKLSFLLENQIFRFFKNYTSYVIPKFPKTKYLNCLIVHLKNKLVIRRDPIKLYLVFHFNLFSSTNNNIIYKFIIMGSLNSCYIYYYHFNFVKLLSLVSVLYSSEKWFDVVIRSLLMLFVEQYILMTILVFQEIKL